MPPFTAIRVSVTRFRGTTGRITTPPRPYWRTDERVNSSVNNCGDLQCDPRRLRILVVPKRGQELAYPNNTYAVCPVGMREVRDEISKGLSMKRHVLTQLGCYLVIIAGLLAPSVGQAQSDLSPAKSNCDSKTGCANYSTGNVTNQNPMQQSNSTAAANPPGSDLSPAKSNCDSKTGCANYSTGDVTKTNPANPSQQK